MTLLDAVRPRTGRGLLGRGMVSRMPRAYRLQQPHKLLLLMPLAAEHCETQPQSASSRLAVAELAT